MTLMKENQEESKLMPGFMLPTPLATMWSFGIPTTIVCGWASQSVSLISLPAAVGPTWSRLLILRWARKSARRSFDLDYNEYRRKNQVKTSLATNATLTSLGAHLFGAEGAVSNRKVFGLLVRAVGLGQFGESNGWPIAMARRRFKCGKGDTETDTESICGDTCEEADVGNCCIMWSNPSSDRHWWKEGPGV